MYELLLHAGSFYLLQYVNILMMMMIIIILIIIINVKQLCGGGSYQYLARIGLFEIRLTLTAW